MTLTLTLEEVQQFLSWLVLFIKANSGPPTTKLPRPCPLTIRSRQEVIDMASHMFKYTIAFPAVSGPTVTKRTVSTVVNGGAPTTADYDVALATFEATFSPHDTFSMTLVESDAAGAASPPSAPLDVTVPAASIDTLPQPGALTVQSAEEIVSP